MENNVKIATGGIAEEYRKLKVGESVSFPLSKYKYNSVRNSMCSTLVNERMNDDVSWRTRLDKDNKCVIVTRIS